MLWFHHQLLDKAKLCVLHQGYGSQQLLLYADIFNRQVYILSLVALKYWNKKNKKYHMYQYQCILTCVVTGGWDKRGEGAG